MDTTSEERIKIKQIQPLLDLANDPQVSSDTRVASLAAASHFPLTRGAWLNLAHSTDDLRRELPDWTRERAQLVPIALRIPLRSWHGHLHNIAANPFEGDSDLIAKGLAQQGDITQLKIACSMIANGNEEGYEYLARMPIETVREKEDFELLQLRIKVGNRNRISADGAFWQAVALARLGEFAPLDKFLVGDVEPPSILWGDPWSAQARIASVLPVSEKLRKHLMLMQEKSQHGVMTPEGELIVNALLLPPGEEDGVLAVPSGFSSSQVTPEQIIRALAVAEKIRQGYWDEPWQLANEIATLPKEEVPKLVLDVIELGNKQVMLSNDQMIWLEIGNDIVTMLQQLPVDNWPVIPLIESQLRSNRPALSSKQMAWLVARAGADQFFYWLPDLLKINHNQKEVLDLIKQVGIELNRAGGPPILGAGPGEEDDTVPFSGLIDDPEETKHFFFGHPKGLETSESYESDWQIEREAQEPDEPNEERRVQVEIWHEGKARRTFVAGGKNMIRCWIGLEKSTVGEETDEPIPNANIPKEGLILSVELFVRMLSGDQSVRGTLHLPASRTARSGDCDLSFNIPEGERYRSIVAEILFRYRGAVFELVRIGADVLAPDDDESVARVPLSVLVDIARRETIDLTDREEIDVVFVNGSDPAAEREEETSDNIRIYGQESSQEISLGETKRLMNVLNERLFLSEKTLVRQREREGSLESLVDINLEDEELKEILRLLARHGTNLYNELPKNEELITSRRIQLFNRRPDDYIPLEFVYDRGYPTDQAELCAEGFAALDSELDQCPVCGTASTLSNEERVNATKICPFGFWSLQKIIERNNPDMNIYPTNERHVLPPLDSVLFASSNRVPSEERKRTWKALTERFEHPAHVSDWRTWRLVLEGVRGTQPLLLVLPHHLIRDEEDCLEIGDEASPEEERLLARGQLIDLYVNPRKVVPGPIVLLLGCQTAAETETGYVDLARQLQKLSVSIVLGTLAKVLGRHAAPVARELVAELVAVNNPEADFGTILRRVRRRMLMKGYLMALCLVALGDAEWRLSPRC